MPAKKNHLTDAERAKRIRKLSKEIETSNDPADFERAFGKVVKAAPAPKPKDQGPQA